MQKKVFNHEYTAGDYYSLSASKIAATITVGDKFTGEQSSVSMTKSEALALAAAITKHFEGSE